MATTTIPTVFALTRTDGKRPTNQSFQSRADSACMTSAAGWT